MPVGSRLCSRTSCLLVADRIAGVDHKRELIAATSSASCLLGFGLTSRPCVRQCSTSLLPVHVGSVQRHGRHNVCARRWGRHCEPAPSARVAFSAQCQHVLAGRERGRRPPRPFSARWPGRPASGPRRRRRGWCRRRWSACGYWSSVGWQCRAVRCRVAWICSKWSGQRTDAVFSHTTQQDCLSFVYYTLFNNIVKHYSMTG